MIFFTDKKMPVFQSAGLREAAGNVANPGRGWYRIYTYTLGAPEKWEMPPVLYEGETLALVLINIGAWREQPLDGESLSLIDRILGCFAAGGRDIILRIVYDTQGKGMEHEPSLFSQVRQHMEQLGPLLVNHCSHILVFQGLLVGSWGEMHTSKFVSEKYLCQLFRSFQSGTRGKVRLAVRKPVQCRMLLPEDTIGEAAAGCFDDALLASETHLGTFGTQGRGEAGWKKPWCPAEEIAFLEKLSERVPFGGEVLSSEVSGGETVLSPQETVDHLRALHVSYLNCIHEEARLREWRQTEYAAGISLYDYVGAHLGYRFTVEAVSCEKRGKGISVKVKIANRGFACCGEKVRFCLHLQAQEERVIPVDCALGGLAAGESLTLRIPLEGGLPEKGTHLYGELRRERDQRSILFANEPVGERLLLGAFV